MKTTTKPIMPQAAEQELEARYKACFSQLDAKADKNSPRGYDNSLFDLPWGWKITCNTRGSNRVDFSIGLHTPYGLNTEELRSAIRSYFDGILPVRSMRVIIGINYPRIDISVVRKNSGYDARPQDDMVQYALDYLLYAHELGFPPRP